MDITTSFTCVFVVSLVIALSATNKFVAERVKNNKQKLAEQFEALVLDGEPSEMFFVMLGLFKFNIFEAFLALFYFRAVVYK